MLQRATDLPVWPAEVRFVLALLVTEWHGLSLTRILAVAFTVLPFMRTVGFYDVLFVFVILGAIITKDNFGNFERIGKLLPRFGRRDSDSLRSAAIDTAVLAEETKDAAKDVVKAIDKGEPTPRPYGGEVP